MTRGGWDGFSEELEKTWNEGSHQAKIREHSLLCRGHGKHWDPKRRMHLGYLKKESLWSCSTANKGDSGVSGGGRGRPGPDQDGLYEPQSRTGFYSTCTETTGDSWAGNDMIWLTAKQVQAAILCGEGLEGPTGEARKPARVSLYLSTCRSVWTRMVASGVGKSGQTPVLREDTIRCVPTLLLSVLITNKGEDGIYK